MSYKSPETDYRNKFSPFNYLQRIDSCVQSPVSRFPFIRHPFTSASRKHSFMRNPIIFTEQQIPTWTLLPCPTVKPSSRTTSTTPFFPGANSPDSILSPSNMRKVYTSMTLTENDTSIFHPG